MSDLHAAEPEEKNVYREGTVVRSTGSWYDVQTEQGTVSSKIRGKFRLDTADVTNPVAVGDRVTIRLNADGTGLITEIHSRRNKLSRRASGRRTGREHVIVANVNRAWAVQAVRRPRFNPGFIDRFLVMAGVYEIPAGLIFNKIDLLCSEGDESTFEQCTARYEALGYPVHRTSATEEIGLDTLREGFAEHVNVVTGPSGVGKSTLLNRIEPGLDLKTRAVSEKSHAGRHTTTYAALYPLSGGGYVADTPGLRAFRLIDLAPEELSHYFVEFVPYLDDCRFRGCTHDHEPGCAVKAAVGAGTISHARYESYLNLLDALREHAADVGY